MHNYPLVLFWLESGNFGLLIIVTTSLIHNPSFPHGQVSRFQSFTKGGASLSWALGLCSMSLTLCIGGVPRRPLVTPVPLAAGLVVPQHMLLMPASPPPPEGGPTPLQPLLHNNYSPPAEALSSAKPTLKIPSPPPPTQHTGIDTSSRPVQFVKRPCCPSVWQTHAPSASPSLDSEHINTQMAASQYLPCQTHTTRPNSMPTLPPVPSLPAPCPPCG